MERYRSAIDILSIAVILDHRFLWLTCSPCLFLSACPNVFVDLQQSDSAVVPLPSPCGRVLGQVALVPSLINKSVWLVWTSLPLYMLFACVSVAVYVLWYSGVYQPIAKPSEPDKTNAVWQLFSLCIVAPHRSICASDLIPPINEEAALSDWQRKKKKSLRVAFRRTINGSHPIYQTEHLYVCLSLCVCALVFVSALSMVFILFISV